MWLLPVAMSVVGGLSHPLVPRQKTEQLPRHVVPLRIAEGVEAQRQRVNEGADRINEGLSRIVEKFDDSIRRSADRIAELRADGVGDADPRMINAKETLARYQLWRIQYSGLKAAKIGR